MNFNPKRLSGILILRPTVVLFDMVKNFNGITKLKIPRLSEKEKSLKKIFGCLEFCPGNRGESSAPACRNGDDPGDSSSRSRCRRPWKSRRIHRQSRARNYHNGPWGIVSKIHRNGFETFDTGSNLGEWSTREYSSWSGGLASSVQSSRTYDSRSWFENQLARSLQSSELSN